jgi:anthranilate 1,2-dioxygenase ferredoxin subunit
VFEISTGKPCGGPVTQAVRSFPVQLRAGRVEVGVEAQS